MSAMKQLSAVGDGADRFARSAIQVMLRSVKSGKVNFADVLPMQQKIWKKIPLIINDVPLEEQCRTLLNMTNGNRKLAIRRVVEGHFEASPQLGDAKAGSSSSLVDSLYSSNGLNMFGYVTKHLLNFVLPGNIGSQAEAVTCVRCTMVQGDDR